MMDEIKNDVNDPKIKLFLQQKALLDTFLEHKAISREQYDTSLNGLIVKMGFENSGILDDLGMRTQDS